MTVINGHISLHLNFKITYYFEIKNYSYLLKIHKEHLAFASFLEYIKAQNRH